MSLIGDGIGPFTLRKGIQFQESGKKFSGLCNSEYNSRNREYHKRLESKIQVLLAKTKDWNPVAGIRNPRRGIPDSGLPWIPLHSVKPPFQHDYFSSENVCPLD